MFTNVYVGLLGFLNLEKVTFDKHAKYKSLLHVDRGITNGPFLQYLMDVKVYFLISQMMTPFKEEG
jgi:hypothetical protein